MTSRIGDTLDRPELQIATQFVDLAWHRLQAGEDLRNRSIPHPHAPAARTQPPRRTRRSNSLE
jgi:hypothetical protein